MTKEQFKDWLEKLIHIWETKDPNGVLDLVAEKFLWYETPFDELITTKEKLLHEWQTVLDQNEINVTYEILSLGNNIGIAHWNATFIRLPSGEKAELDGIYKVVLDENGKCTEFHQWYNSKTPTSDDPNFIKEEMPKDKVYSIFLSRLDSLEKSTISKDRDDEERAFENSMDIGFKLFPLIDAISLTLLGKPNGRKYLEELGYSDKEAYMIYAIFRNGIMHTSNPYMFEFDDGKISWGLTSSGGTSGFTPHYPGYFDKENPEFNVPADKAFTYHKLRNGEYHAILSLDSLVAHIKYDLTERKITDNRKFIDFIVGQHMRGKAPKPKGN